MYVGKLLSIRDILMETLKNAKVCSVNSLRETTSDLCSLGILKSELRKLFLDGYISDYRSPIRWIWDEEKARQIKYRVVN